MGKWAKSLFGAETFSDTGIIVAGHNPEALENRTLGIFDEAVSNRDSMFHAHLVRKSGKFYPVVFNVYGAPTVIDVLAHMHDGGCRTVLFVGYAFGFGDSKVGDVIVPSVSYHFDGAYANIDPKKQISSSNTSLKYTLWTFLNSHSVDYSVGVNISVPAVTLQLPHENEHYAKIQPSTLEMELASFFSRSKEIGIRAAGILIVSDTRYSTIIEREARKKKKIEILELLFRNIDAFALPHLNGNFSVDSCLADIVGGQDNVYKRQ